MQKSEVHVIAALADNYTYVIAIEGRALVVDPSESQPVQLFLIERNLSLTHILLTHYDHDHVGGVTELVRRNRARVIGPEPSTICLDEVCKPGSSISLGGELVFDVIDTPGHAFPHVAYLERNQHWLFSGDCLFGAGCGRVSRNAYGVMWKSLCALSGLADDTRVFFGHEYTLSNLDFAASVEPGNSEIERRRSEVRAGLSRGLFSSPSTMGQERMTNPFLRVNSPEIRACLGLPDASDEEVFAELRKRKNQFKG